MNNDFNIQNPKSYKVALYIRLSKEDLKPRRIRKYLKSKIYITKFYQAI